MNCDHTDDDRATACMSAKPWTRWWWMGSAVTMPELTRHLEAFAAVGIGGVEITPIYGVRGQESACVDYLSPRWIEMLAHTLREAKRLGLGVDMTLGTGWPWGGKHVRAEHAPRQLNVFKEEVAPNMAWRHGFEGAVIEAAAWRTADGRLQSVPVEAGSREMEWMTGLPWGDVALRLWQQSYGFDIISDRLVQNLKMQGARVLAVTSEYRVIVVPPCRTIPLETLRQLQQLAKAGAMIVFMKDIPGSQPGLRGLDDAGEFAATMKALLPQYRLADDYSALLRVLAEKRIFSNPVVSIPGLHAMRLLREGRCGWFVVNQSNEALDGWVTFAAEGRDWKLYDPLTGLSGRAASRHDVSGVAVYLQLHPGRSCFVLACDSEEQGPWPYARESGQVVEPAGKWELEFISGGPTLPARRTLTEMKSWTLLDDWHQTASPQWTARASRGAFSKTSTSSTSTTRNSTRPSGARCHRGWWEKSGSCIVFFFLVLSLFELRWADGRITRPLARLDQPQIGFDESGKPAVLFLAVKEHRDDDSRGCSYNVQVPLLDPAHPSTPP